MLYHSPLLSPHSHATSLAQSSDLHKRLSRVLVTLQEHIRDRSFTGLLSRLQLIAEKHRLKCVTQGQQFYLTSDSFFVEVCAYVLTYPGSSIMLSFASCHNQAVMSLYTIIEEECGPWHIVGCSSPFAVDL